MQSKGEYRVGISFNPSGNGTVDEIKRKAADFIDFLDAAITTGGFGPERANEVGRLKALAATHIEDAAMWAMKAATKGENE